ncbi:Contact-dependent inhibition of growth factor CdiA (plasmid) [Pantoea sp. SGAir0175]
MIMDDRQPVSPFRRALSYFICYLVAVQPLLPVVAAEITPVTPGTRMDAAGNGVPVVNIATPNQAGISHNQYQQYNVGQQGLILNNASGQLTQTQLGGLIQNNPNLQAGHEARAIINEVVGANRSQLQGYTEVAGKAANVIVANPYGITCNGCGFINTPNVTLTTGKPQLDASGNLAALEVTKGDVTVEGKGLDGSRADAVSLIARATKINADIHASDLAITAGANRVAQDGSVTPIAGEGPVPSVAVDTGALGGMYANRIHLVSSDKGVGVNIGNLLANQGDITLNANGTLTLGNASASGKLLANARDMQLQGTQQATGDVALNSQGNVQLRNNKLTSGGNLRLAASDVTADQNSTVAANGDISVTAQTLKNNGLIQAQKNQTITANTLRNQGRLQSAGGQTLSTASLDNQGLIGSSRALHISATQQALNGATGTLLAGEELNLAGGDFTLNGSVSGKNGLTLSSTSLQTAADARLSSQRNINLSARQQILQGEIASGGSLMLNGDTLTLGSTGRLHSDGDVSLTSSQQATIGGQLDGDNVQLSGGALHLSKTGMLTAQQDLSLTSAQQQLDGQSRAGGNVTLRADRLNALNEGKLSAGNDIALQVNDQSQWAGTLIAGRELAFSATDFVNSGTLAANGNTHFSFDHLTNAGLLQSLGQQTLSGRVLTNNGTAQSGAGQLLDVGKLDNNGLLGAQGDLTLNADQFTAGDGSNTLTDGALRVHSSQADLGGTLSAKHNLDFQSEKLTTRAGSLQTSEQNIQLNGQNIDLNGTLSADQALTLNSQQLSSGDNARTQGKSAIALNVADQADLAGQWFTPGQLTLQAGTLNNRAQTGAQDLTIAADIINNAGTLSANNRLDLTADSLQQQGTLNALGAMAIRSDAWRNQGKTSARTLDISVKNTLDNAPEGSLLASDGLTLNTSALSNAGNLSGQTLELDTEQLTNSGLMQGNQSVTLRSDALNNLQSGQILSGGALKVDAGSTQNAGRLQGSSLQLRGNTLNNSGIALGSKGLDVALQQTLDNAGSLLSDSAATLQSRELNNSGKLLSGEQLSLTGSQLRNQGQMQGDTLAIQADSVSNSGNLIGLKSLVLQLQQDLTDAQSGRLLTQGALNVNAQRINQQGSWQANSIDARASQIDVNGSIQSAVRTSLTSTGNLHTLAQGNIVSSGLAAIQAASLNNEGKWSAKNLQLQGNSLLNQGSATATDELTANLSGQLQQLKGAALLSAGTSTLKAGSIDSAGDIEAKNLVINSGNLTNRGQLYAQQNLSGDVEQAIANQGGVLRSQGALQLNAQSLLNQGQIQGDGITTITLSDSLNNTGRLLTGGPLTLSAPTVLNSGLVQAQGLAYSGNNLVNSGTFTGLGDSLVNASQMTNQGQLQGDNLQVRGGVLHNSGSVFASRALALTLQNADNQATGKLYSAGDLTLNTPVLNAAGSLLALGNMTLQLGSGFTQSGTLAAGKALNLSTQGDLTVLGTLQGNSLQLSSNNFINNGQLRSGSGALNVDASNMTLNDSGSVQAGGDMRLTSRGQLVNYGFVGTAGNLLMTAGSRIENRALLYAGNNMQLLASSIQNNRGDILANNNLWLQRDAAGNASDEVINTSGNIETSLGDITIRTGHLLNQREGISHSISYQAATDAPAGLGQATIKMKLGQLNDDEIGIYKGTEYEEIGGSRGNGNGGTISVPFTSLAPKIDAASRQFLVGSTVTSAYSNGGAGRIAANRNLIVSADSLDNNASNLLAGQDINLLGTNLNNQSWQNSIEKQYLLYKYTGVTGSDNTSPKVISDLRNGQSHGVKYRDGLGSEVVYTLQGAPVYETIQTGEGLRAVIQAGGNVSARFTNNLSNTDTVANAGSMVHAISKPGIAGTAPLQSVGGVQNQQLAAVQTLAVGSPQWKDALTGALQQIGNQGAALTDYPLPAGNNGLFVASKDPASPYLITTNPQLAEVGKTDGSLFDGLNAFLRNPTSGAVQQSAQAVTQPALSSSPRVETAAIYTDKDKFLGSAYLLNRLQLTPDKDYKFLGDAAFDTRYVSNAILSQTGHRYVAGTGSDLQQMQYLMDSAARQQAGLGLQLGVSLSPEQVAALTTSIVWWEKTTVNGQTVLAPKLYLAPGDSEIAAGSVIAGQAVKLDAGQINNDGSTIKAETLLSANSNSSLNNLHAGLLASGGDLQLNAIGDINNIGASISAETVSLASAAGNINNVTQAQQWSSLVLKGIKNAPELSFSDTQLGDVASISASKNASLSAGGNINNTGATLAAGGDLQLGARGDINIAANALHTDRLNKNSSAVVTSSQDGSVSAGGDLTARAGHDLNLSGTTLVSKGDTTLAAANDINLNTLDNSSHQTQGNSKNDSINATRSTIQSSGNLALSAGRDINSQAAQLMADLNASLSAGRDLNLNAQQSRVYSESRGGKKVTINEQVRQTGSEISSGGNIVLAAGNDINSAASEITAKQDIAARAGHDINLTTATESDYNYREETKTKKGLFSKKTTHTIQEDSATHEKGTLLSGNNISVSAGHDLLVKGSQVAGDDNVALSAGNNVGISAATNTESSWRFSETKKSGLMGTGGLGISIGSSKSLHDLKEKGTTQSQSVSTVGSIGGNVSITAGQQLQVQGADLIAGGNMALKGDSVAITPGHDVRTRDERFEQRTSGLTLALSGAVAEAVNSAVSAAQSAKKESDGRLAALQATKAVLSGVQANQASQLAQANGDPNNGVGISISLTTQKSKSQQHQESDAVSGSTLNAGKNLSIDATGKGTNANSGDLLIAGSQLKAGGDTSLHAANDINLTGVASTQQTSGKNSSSGGGIGLSFGVGSGSAGLSIFASVNGAKGHEKGNGIAWSETTLDSGGAVDIRSGRDTTLTGALVNGNSVTADIGRNLSITSLQDSDNYDSKQISFGAGGSFTFGSMTGSGYINASQDKMHSNYDSVLEQSGIYAGQGGFDITVGSHTQLNGAVIASQADADKNHLDTGTLGFTDLHNQADYKTQHQGIGLSSTGNFSGQFKGNMATSMLAGAGSSGHAEGTTQSAVAQGTIVVRDQANQQQDVAALSRDTEHANDSISPIFDKEKEQKRLQTAQLIGEIGSQVADIARTQGQIEATEAGKKELAKNNINQPDADAPAAKKKAYQEALENSSDYKKAMALWGTGSDIQKGIQAATAAIQGLAGGNLAQAASGAAAPYLAEQIHKYTADNQAAKAMAHAVVGAVTSWAAGNSAAAGATGAVSGELMGQLIMHSMYPGKQVSDLQESDKQIISALSTLAAGLAGGVTGGSSASALAGAQAGKNAVENNWLSVQEADRKKQLETKRDYLKQELTPAEAKELATINQTDKARDEAIKAVCTDGNKGGSACGALIGPAQEAFNKYGENATYSLLYRDLYPQDVKNLESVLQGLDAGSISRDQAITAIAQASGVSWETAAGRYDIAMQTQELAAALAGAYGLKSVIKEPTKESSAKKLSQPSAGRTAEPNRNAADEEASGWSQYDKYRNESGDWNWPAKLGFAEEPVKTTLPVGTHLDRYGKTNGSFLAPQGTPQEQRALAPGSLADKYHEYVVIKPLPVMQGKIAPAFGEPGGGIQILPNMQERVNVQWLLDNKYLEKVN